MAFEKLSNSIQDLNTNVQSLIHSNTEYYKLKIFKDSMKGATALVRFLIIITIVSIAALLISVAISIAISEAIGIPSAGYFIVGVFYLLVAAAVFVFGKTPIEKLMLEKFSKNIFNDDKNSE